MNYIKIFLFCAIVSINGCHIYVRSVESICEHIRYKDIDSVKVLSYKKYEYFDTVKVANKKYTPYPGSIKRSEIRYDRRSFILKKEYLSEYVRYNLYELTDSLLTNYRLSAYSEKQISTFSNDSSMICFCIYFTNTSQLDICSELCTEYRNLSDFTSISASKRDRNILESIPYQIPLRGLTKYARNYWTKTSLYKDVINETFNELAVYYNSIESDSSKHVKLLAKPIPIPIK